MIYDWYNGGDWGGLPVRLLGHIMADVINAADEAYRLIKVGLPIGGAHPFGTVVFKKNMTDEVILTGSGVNALPDWFDGIPIGGQDDTGDPFFYNFRSAYRLMEDACTAQTEDLPQFMQDDHESALTMEYLGLGDFDEDSLTRPQQVDAWAAIRLAFERLRYYRGRIRVLTPQFDGALNLSAGTTKDQVNAALSTLWSGLSYTATTPRGYALSYISASATNFGTRAASVNDDDSFEVLMRGADGLNSTPFDRPVMRSYLKFVDAVPASDFGFTTDRGNLSAGWEDDFGMAVESVAFESTITRPYYFTEEFPDSNEQDLRGRANMDATCHAVWDIDASDYPS